MLHVYVPKCGSQQAANAVRQLNGSHARPSTIIFKLGDECERRRQRSGGKDKERLRRGPRARAFLSLLANLWVSQLASVSSLPMRGVGLREISGGSLWVCSKKGFDSKLRRGPQTRDLYSIKVTSKIALL